MSSGRDGTLPGMFSGDARADVDSARRTLALGTNSDVTLASDGVGGFTVNGLPHGGGAVPVIASAAALPTPTTPLAHISGTTNITSIVGNGAAGQRVTLIFDGILTFTDGNNLKLAGNLVTTADDTITLVSDGVNWYETARSVN